MQKENSLISVYELVYTLYLHNISSLLLSESTQIMSIFFYGWEIIIIIIIIGYTIS